MISLFVISRIPFRSWEVLVCGNDTGVRFELGIRFVPSWLCLILEFFWRGFMLFPPTMTPCSRSGLLMCGEYIGKLTSLIPVATWTYSFSGILCGWGSLKCCQYFFVRACGICEEITAWSKLFCFRSCRNKIYAFWYCWFFVTPSRGLACVVIWLSSVILFSTWFSGVHTSSSRNCLLY